jgi:hypothetical protein
VLLTMRAVVASVVVMPPAKHTPSRLIRRMAWMDRDIKRLMCDKTDVVPPTAADTPTASNNRSSQPAHYSVAYQAIRVRMNYIREVLIAKAD